MEHYGFISLIPAIIAMGLAIWSKRVIESLLLALFSAAFIIDFHTNGISHAIIYSINNLFSTIVGHSANPTTGLSGIGLIKSVDRGEILIVVLLLGSFITLLEKSGGAVAFGSWIATKVKTKKGVQNSAAIMGSLLFTSAYFSSLATGTIFKPLFEKYKISKAKLAFILDSTSAPINVLIPISGWVAYMGVLMTDNIPTESSGIIAITKTIPFNFYCIILLVMVFLITNNIIKDFGPMKVSEQNVESEQDSVNAKSVDTVKDGSKWDMIIPLGISVILLVVLGLWNYTMVPFFDLPKIPMGGSQMLILSFSIGIIVAFIQYTYKKLMSAVEFLDLAIDGMKSAIIGGVIITLAVTLGDLMRTAAPEGLGTAKFLTEISKSYIPSSIVPFAVFILASFMGFSMGTSWGVWAIMMPIAIPLTLATGGNPIIAAAAILAGGTFGDHCSPISDTTIMSSIGAGCDHMEHVNTQLPYALVAAGISAVLYLIAGFLF